MADNIRKFLDLSTAHISGKTNSWLESEGRPSIHQTDAGWFLWCSLFNEEMPRDLLTVVAYARGLGCCYVMLDRDAELIEALPTYEW